MIRSYFNDIRGLISRIYIMKIEHEMKQGLKDIIFKEAVYHKFNTLLVNVKEDYKSITPQALDVNKVYEV